MRIFGGYQIHTLKCCEHFGNILQFKMGKKVKETQLTKFVWKRNPQYDLELLAQVECKNPFAFKKDKPIWEDIAKTLQEGNLKMKVTERSCRDRTKDLLKNHRKDELESVKA